MASFVGLDVGYGFVKVTDGERGYAFPSVIGEGTVQKAFRTILQSPQPVDELAIEIEGNSYFVGKAAIRHAKVAFRDLSAARNLGGDFKILFLAALSLFCSDAVNNFKVVTGLPPGRIHMTEDLIKQVIGDHRVVVNRNEKPEEIEISVKQLEVVPQPLGTYWSEVLDPWGQIKDAVGGRVGIIDIGYRTTDLAAIEEGEFIPEKSRTITVGMDTVYGDVAYRILAEHALERESHALDEAVIKGRLNVAGKEVDISEARNRSLERLANKVAVELMSAWKLPEYDQLIVSGGGGQAIGPYLLPYLPQGKLADDPVTANSKGYIAWANRRWKLVPETAPIGSEG